MVVSDANEDTSGGFRDAQKTLVVHVKQLYDETDESSNQAESLGEAPVSVSLADDGETLSENDSGEPESFNLTADCVVDSSGRMWREIPPHRGLKANRAGVARWYEEGRTDRYQCLFCNEIFGACDLRSHQFDQHKYRLPEVGKSAFLKYIRRDKVPVASALTPGTREGTGACPHCPQSFARRLDLLTHLNVDHGKQFVLFDLDFDSADEFDQWLEIITYKYMTGYTKNRTNVAQSGMKTQMYLCRMEEKPRKSKVFKTERRAQNRTRAQYCTAHLVVRFLEGGRLHVKGSPTHINHDVTLFSACRSLDDVPMDGLPGYAAVISASSRGIPKTTIDVCQNIFKKADAMKSLLGTCPAPANKNVVKILHSNLSAMLDPISSYKLKAVVLQGDSEEIDSVDQ
ncbi:uncharacterized protein LOC100903483 [Galendromus occidentalis]|uniref:Uncharacterized protein LOC100903483 n=1 Tax=Galendromus occidentalis TaxID=34638 RepID=A0AAJ6QZ01_9ACAR|nr:uncharacterized protein LOC100903483 [Galendromus occidentalis]